MSETTLKSWKYVKNLDVFILICKHCVCVAGRQMNVSKLHKTLCSSKTLTYWFLAGPYKILFVQIVLIGSFQHLLLLKAHDVTSHPPPLLPFPF